MTDNAIQARVELKAWLEKYNPRGSVNCDRSEYPTEPSSCDISVDGAIIAIVVRDEITIQGE